MIQEEIFKGLIEPRVETGSLAEYNFHEAIGFEDYEPEYQLIYVTALDADLIRKLYFAIDGSRIIWQY